MLYASAQIIISCSVGSGPWQRAQSHHSICVAVDWEIAPESILLLGSRAAAKLLICQESLIVYTRRKWAACLTPTAIALTLYSVHISFAGLMILSDILTQKSFEEHVHGLSTRAHTEYIATIEASTTELALLTLP